MFLPACKRNRRHLAAKWGNMYHPSYIHRGNPYHHTGAGIAGIFRHLIKGLSPLLKLFVKGGGRVAKKVLRAPLVRKTLKDIGTDFAKSGADLTRDLVIGAKNKQVKKIRRKLLLKPGPAPPAVKRKRKAVRPRKLKKSIFND